MSFVIINKDHEKLVHSVRDGLHYMANDLSVMLAQHNDETGLSISMMILAVGESLTLEDGKGNDIQVKRLK